MNNAAVKVMYVCVKGTQFLLQALVQVAMIAIRRVHCGTIEGERGVLNSSQQCTDPEAQQVCSYTYICTYVRTRTISIDHNVLYALAHNSQ